MLMITDLVQQRALEETKKVFPEMQRKIKDALTTLEEQLVSPLTCLSLPLLMS